MSEEFNQETLLAGLDDCVERLLREKGILSPPVDVRCIAPRDSQARRIGSGRGSGLPAARAVAHAAGVESREHVEQRLLALAIARKLIEQVLPMRRSSPRVSSPGSTRLVAACVSRLLIPTAWLRDDIRHMGYDLCELCRRYATASMASIAWRLLDLDSPLAVSMFDNNHLVDRRANVPGVQMPPLDPAELAAQSYAHQYSRTRLENSPAVTARAWPSHQPGWRREIVIAQFDCDLGEPPGCED